MRDFKVIYTSCMNKAASNKKTLEKKAFSLKPVWNFITTQGGRAKKVVANNANKAWNYVKNNPVEFGERAAGTAIAGGILGTGVYAGKKIGDAVKDASKNGKQKIQQAAKGIQTALDKRYARNSVLNDVAQYGGISAISGAGVALIHRLLGGDAKNTGKAALIGALLGMAGKGVADNWDSIKGAVGGLKDKVVNA